MTTIYKTRLIRKTEVADQTMEFRFDKPDGLEYTAGQFFDIILPKSSPDAEQSSWKHGFSFVSAPYEDWVGAATRMRSGSRFKQALAQVPEGTELELEAVWGDFTLRKSTAKPMVFLIGGIGITPVMSMVKQATHGRTGHRMTLIYANHKPENAAYVDELKALAQQNPNFRFVQTYTESGPQGSGVEHGRVDAAMLQRHVPDLQAPAYYMSGPRGMVYAMRELLESLDVDEDALHTEEFEGY